MGARAHTPKNLKMKKSELEGVHEASVTEHVVLVLKKHLNVNMTKVKANVWVFLAYGILAAKTRAMEKTNQRTVLKEQIWT